MQTTPLLLFQKRDGITSDGDGIHDDDSSSLSERQEKRSQRKKKFNARKFFRKVGNQEEVSLYLYEIMIYKVYYNKIYEYIILTSLFILINLASQDGYESSSDVSTGSTRSTSSSFLRYQNRAIWKARLRKKSVLQRRGDGVETPVEDEMRSWPMFDRIYKRQNQLSKKGDIDEDAEFDDADSVSSGGGDEECPLAPPAPIFIGIEGEECFGEEVEYEQPKEDAADCRVESNDGAFGRFRRKFMGGRPSISEGAEGKETDNMMHKENNVLKVNASPTAVWEIFEGQPKSDTSPQVESHPETSQKESGIPTSEAPKVPRTKSEFPTQKLALTDNIKPEQPLAKPPRQPSQKKKTSFKEEERKDIVPLSIPRTISYSLRSAIGDGSERQRNSHSLMERRPLRPNGCSVDVSYWSHRGKRNYMEGEWKYLSRLFGTFSY